MDPSARIHLPTYATSLIGRASDVAALTGLVQNPAERMITLVGASGSGKTRLALEVAAAVTPTFSDGVVFVALAPVTDPRFVLTAIATQLDIQEQGQEPLLTTLCRYLADKRLLLLLDNMEQVQAAAANLVPLSAAAPHLTILVTSQVALAISGETVYDVPPLGVPADAMVRDPQSVLAYPGTALFVERLRAVQPRFRLTVSSAQAVAHICQVLDGYPLAIELVAAHSATLAPEDLLLLLRNHLGVRSHQGPVAFSSRTAILHPVLDWCSSRLPALGKHLLLRLGVFQGGWTTEAAHAVLAPEYDLERVAETLALLAQKHLVLIETLAGQAPRYGVLDAIRDYSTTRLVKQRKAAAVQVRHAHYVQALAVEADGALRGPEQAIWLGRLNAEIHNLRAAMQWALDHESPALALTIATNLYLFWNSRAWYTEGRAWLTQALPAAPDAPPAERATAWKVLGVLLMRQGAMADSLAACSASLQLYEAAGAIQGQVAVLNNIGVLQMEQGQWAAAQQAYERATELLRTVPEPNTWLRAILVANLGVILEKQGQYAAAQPWTEESLALRRQLNDQGGIAISLMNLGVLASKTGDLIRAQALINESMALCQQLGEQRILAMCWWNLGGMAIEQEHDAVAEQHYTRALEVFTTTNNLQGQATIYAGLGYLRRLQGDYGTAETALAQASALATAANDQAVLLQVALQRSALALDREELSAAWAELQAQGAAILANHNRVLVVEAAELAALILILRHESPFRAVAAQLWQQSQAVRAAWGMPLNERDTRWAARHGSSALAEGRGGPGAGADAAILVTTLSEALERVMNF